MSKPIPVDKGFLVDRLTQQWVRATGRRITLREFPWLDGPVGDPRLIAEEWIGREALRHGARVEASGGLIKDFADLAGPGFDPSRIPSAAGRWSIRGRHALARLAPGAMLRQRSYWETSWGQREEFYIDAVADHRRAVAGLGPGPSGSLPPRSAGSLERSG